MSNITTTHTTRRVKLTDQLDGETLTIETNDEGSETRYIVSYDDAITHSLTYEELDNWINELRGAFGV